MNVSQVAKASGLSSQTVRYYESIGLVSPVRRADNGYRDFSAKDLDRLCFLKQSRATGFSLEESRELLSLYDNQSRQSADVKHLIEEKLEQIEDQIHALLAMRDTLSDLANSCPGDDHPNCSIIDRLAQRSSINSNRSSQK